jgi:hypothetical protein
MDITLFIVSSTDNDDFIAQLQDMDFPGQVEVIHFQLGGFVSGRALVEIVENIEEIAKHRPVICCFTDTFWQPDEYLVERLRKAIVWPSVVIVPANTSSSVSFPSSIQNSNVVIRGDNAEEILKIGVDNVNDFFEREGSTSE